MSQRISLSVRRVSINRLVAARKSFRIIPRLFTILIFSMFVLVLDITIRYPGLNFAATGVPNDVLLVVGVMMLAPLFMIRMKTIPVWIMYGGMAIGNAALWVLMGTEWLIPNVRRDLFLNGIQGFDLEEGVTISLFLFLLGFWIIRAYRFLEILISKQYLQLLRYAIAIERNLTNTQQKILEGKVDDLPDTKRRLASVLQNSSVILKMIGTVLILMTGVVFYKINLIFPNARELDVDEIVIVGLFGSIQFAFYLSVIAKQFRLRLIVSLGENVLKPDPRSPVLLLRSFQQDDLIVKKKWEWRDSLNVLDDSLTFEATLSQRLWHVGPVLAAEGSRTLACKFPAWLRNRWEKLLHQDHWVTWFPPLGGIRIKTEKEWERTVFDKMLKARLIVTILGIFETGTNVLKDYPEKMRKKTAPLNKGLTGLEKEIERIFSQRYIQKTLFLMPPVSKKRRKHIWEQFFTVINVHPPESLQIQSVLGVCFLSDEKALIIEGRRHSQWFYESAIDAATYFLLHGLNGNFGVIQHKDSRV